MDELFQTWDERFRDTFGPLPLRVRTLLERFLRCGDLHFGFLRLRCANPDCKDKGERLGFYVPGRDHDRPELGNQPEIWRERKSWHTGRQARAGSRETSRGRRASVTRL